MGALGCCVCATTKDSLGNRAERKLQFLTSVLRISDREANYDGEDACYITWYTYTITAPLRTDFNVLGSYLTGRFLAGEVTHSN